MSTSIADLRFTPATPADQATGLLGYLAFTLDDRLRLDGVALRRTRDGEYRLSFPERRDRVGRRHPLVLPLDTATRIEIETQVLAALREDLL